MRALTSSRRAQSRDCRSGFLIVHLLCYHSRFIASSAISVLYGVALPFLFLNDILSKRQIKATTEDKAGKKRETKTTPNPHAAAHTTLLTLLAHLSRLLPLHTCSHFLFDVEHELALAFNAKFEESAPGSSTPNMHGATHCREDSFKHGPSASRTLFSLERNLGVLARFSNNYSDVAHTFAQRWLMRQAMRNLDAVSVCDSSGSWAPFAGIVRDLGVPSTWYGDLDVHSRARHEVCSFDETGRDSMDETYYYALRTHHPLHAPAVQYLRELKGNPFFLSNRAQLGSSSSSSSSSLPALDLTVEFGSTSFADYLRVPVCFSTAADARAPHPPKDKRPVFADMHLPCTLARLRKWERLMVTSGVARAWTSPKQVVDAVTYRLNNSTWFFEHLGFSPSRDVRCGEYKVAAINHIHLHKRLVMRANDVQTQVKSQLWCKLEQRSCVLVCDRRRDCDVQDYLQANSTGAIEGAYHNDSFLHPAVVLAIVEVDLDLVDRRYMETVNAAQWHVEYANDDELPLSRMAHACAYFCLVDFFLPHEQHRYRGSAVSGRTYTWPWSSLAHVWNAKKDPLLNAAHSQLRGTAPPTATELLRDRARRLIPVSHIAAHAAMCTLQAKDAAAMGLHRSFRDTNVTPVIVSAIPLHS